jgi:hypothetical protein
LRVLPVARVSDAVHRWKAVMSWGLWLKSFLGVAVTPLTLDFALGDF